MKRVLLGMSGGVDSSTAAYLLKEQGYEVVGVTMTLFTKENDTSCIDAKKVCDTLGIEHHIVNYQAEFKNHVIDNFINSYKNAQTPNPCIECNKHLKFGLLWKKAQELNCEYIATGHYAAIKNGKLCKIDSPKDQSYFLYKIDKSILNNILFPLSEYPNKETIREIASNLKLETAKKKDSQDICFIENGVYTKFLEENMDKLPDSGNFVLKTGEVLGKHKGIIYYTIGQRKGLGISYKHPLYVISINKDTNEVILGTESDLYSNTIEITDVNLLVDKLPIKALGKIRYKYQPTPCSIEVLDNNDIKVTFDEPVKSATPGQSLVLYDNDICLGGGTINKIYSE